MDDPALVDRLSVSTPSSDRLIVAYLPLAHRMAKDLWKSLPKWAVLGDIDSDALLGLLEAARSFDADRHVQFAAHARKRIHGRMMDGIREGLGRFRAKRHATVVSLDRPAHAGLPHTLGETLADPTPDVIESIATREEVAALLRHLHPADRAVLESYYIKGLLMREMAAADGVKAQTVSIRLRKARNRLRECIFEEEMGGDNHG